MKNTFSSNIEESLNGRTTTDNDLEDKKPPVTTQDENPASGSKKNRTKKATGSKPNAKTKSEFTSTSDLGNKQPIVTEQPTVSEQPVASSGIISLKPDKGLGKNMDGTYRQSRAGRHAVDPKKKKTQMVVTLLPSTKQELENWAEGKPRSAANYLSDYIESHIQDIMNHYDRI